MAKKGREARIMRTITKIRGDTMSEALKRRAASNKKKNGITAGGASSSGGADDGAGVSRWRKKKDKAKIRVEARGTSDAPHGYHGGMKVLCVGDGNMSFALALATVCGNEGTNLVVTTRETLGVARKIYGDACDATVEALEACGATVHFGVECETLRARAKTLQETSSGSAGAFDRIVFNFPDAGVGKVGPLSVQAQRELLASFFENAPSLLKGSGEMHVALQTGPPYAGWNIEGVGAKCGVVLKTVVEFEASDFPGYEYCHTATEDEEDEIEPRADDIECECATYIFVKGAGAST
jgi:25S rRNA (uracil2634-N3)-methyltransferase